LGQKGRLNISLYNSGKAPAYKVEIRSEIKPSEGLDAADLDKSYFEIDPGATESYSAEMTGKSSGEYTVNLKVSYLDGNDAILEDGSTTIVVLEREYKYLYYLLILPLLAVAIWLIKRYKEYKY
jgi:hypothetical protein